MPGRPIGWAIRRRGCSAASRSTRSCTPIHRHRAVSVAGAHRQSADHRLGEAGAGRHLSPSPAAARLRARRSGRPCEQSRARASSRRSSWRRYPFRRSCSASPMCRRPSPSLLSLAVQLNILLAVFNMLPIPPLDGGNVLSGLLPLRFAAMLDKVRPYGILLLYALMFTGRLLLPRRPAVDTFCVSWLPLTVTAQSGRASFRECGRRDACIWGTWSARSATGCRCRRSTTASISSPTGTR